MRKALTLSLLVLAAFASLTCAGNRKPAAAAHPSQFAQEAFKASFQEAERDTKLVLVDFYTDWCKWCKVLDEKTYPDPKVKEIMDRSFVFEKYNPETAPSFAYNGKTYGGADVAGAFNVRGFPTILFLDRDGSTIGSIPGFVPPEVFVKILDFVASGGYKKKPFDEFIQGL